MERRIPNLQRMMKQREVHPDVKRKLSNEKKLNNRGGARPGAGRKKGSLDSVNVALDKLINKIIDENTDGQELTAKVLYQRVYRNPKVPSAVRMRAAKEVLAFESARLAATEVTGAGGGPIEHTIEDIRASIYRKLVKTAKPPVNPAVPAKP